MEKCHNIESFSIQARRKVQVGRNPLLTDNETNDKDIHGEMRNKKLPIFRDNVDSDQNILEKEGERGGLPIIGNQHNRW